MGVKKALQTKEKLSIAASKQKRKKGKEHPLFGKPAKIKGLKRPIIKCSHCGKEGGNNGMKRYHFDNCKLKPINQQT